MNKDELLNYIGGPYRQEKYEFKSAYRAALSEARFLTGRNIETGEISDSGKVGTWSGALVYMTLIDHIGGVFKRDSRKRKLLLFHSNFTSALESFTELNVEEIFALYALRCSFAHDFFLFNKPKPAHQYRDLLTHHFAVTRGTNKLVQLPQVKWSGEWKDLKNSVTIVDLQELGSMVENMHKLLLKLIEEGDVEVYEQERISNNYLIYETE